MATVITADIGLAGQLAPGDRDPFRGVHAATGDGRADQAGAGADGDRAGRAPHERSATGGLRRRSAPSASDGMFRWRRCTTFRRRRTGRMVRRDADAATKSSRRCALAHAAGVPVTMLGGGSNVLVSDAGVRGLVIRPRGGAIARLDPSRVRADAAVTINGLVRWTIMHGAAGLEAWAGTPGTVGRRRVRQRALRRAADRRSDRRGATRRPRRDDEPIVPAAAMAFGYDRSRLQDTGEVLLSATFRRRTRRSGGAARDGARIARVSKAHAAAGYAERGMRLSEPAAGSRRRARRDSLVGRRARRPRRPQGRCDWRRARLARRTAISSSTTDTRRRPTSGG